MVQLTTTQVYLPAQTPPPPPAAVSMTIAKPVSYEFRVVEYKKDDKITKVRLQVQTWEHDQWGVGTVIQTWTDVERISLPDVS